MRKVFVAVLVAVAVSVSACAPVYYVRAISANGTVVCQAGSAVRTYRATGSQLRSIHIGDRCPN